MQPVGTVDLTHVLMSGRRSYKYSKVTEEVLIAETAVWTTPFSKYVYCS